MREAVSEVRQLCLALERSAAVIPRLQVTLQRMLIQQDALRTATREWDQARDQVRISATFEAELAARISRFEAEAARQPDAAKREQFALEVKANTAHMDRHRAKMAELRVHENELAGRQRAEQANSTRSAISFRLSSVSWLCRRQLVNDAGQHVGPFRNHCHARVVRQRRFERGQCGLGRFEHIRPEMLAEPGG